MKKFVFGFVIVFLASSSLYAQTITTRDRNGRLISTESTNSAGITTTRDRNGRLISTESTN